MRKIQYTVYNLHDTSASQPNRRGRTNTYSSNQGKKNLYKTEYERDVPNWYICRNLRALVGSSQFFNVMLV